MTMTDDDLIECLDDLAEYIEFLVDDADEISQEDKHWEMVFTVADALRLMRGGL